MAREMRRKRQSLSAKAITEVLERNNAAILSLIGDDGYPYGVPLTYVYGNDGNFYFHSAKIGHKIDAIRNNSKACVTVIDENNVVPEEYTTYFRSVIATGEVSILDSDEEKLDKIKLLSQKIRPGAEKEMNEAIDREWKGFVIIRFKPVDIKGKEAIELVKKEGQISRDI
ncbi:MAG: pyridoxamine 5'-phosphate oxidase family protein [Clostridiales bacterium]|nr:pyridoxamine 5'-phosphate oxidase family protein [Clostridiales bacterium]MDY4060975.1 pyridoxamine 5'-phosphate oxidase family protein [Anaerovoracaceae bacterium]